jgi:aminoglycoside 2''-phosphotransferase
MDRISNYLQAIAEQYPDFAVESARILNEAGQFNDVLLVNEEFVFRFPRYGEGIRSLQTEVVILRYIAGRVPLAVPDPLYVNADAQAVGRAFMGYRMIPGEILWREVVAGLRDMRLLRDMAVQLAGFLHDLHHLPFTSLGLDLPVQDTGHVWAQMYADFRQHLFPFMRPDARAWVNDHFETYLSDPSMQAFEPSLRHGDFGPSNLLYNPGTWRISGIIDFDSAGVGDPALDLAAVSCYGDRFFQKFCEAYPVEERMPARARFYRGTFALQEALHGILNGDKEAFEGGIAGYVW